MSELSTIKSLSGKLSVNSSLSGSLSPEATVSGSLSAKDLYPAYTGNYSVTPSVDTAITLNTKDRIMINDVVIEKVPYRVNDNLSDGLTVYIGK